jgi:hypothetical protein
MHGWHVQKLMSTTFPRIGVVRVDLSTPTPNAPLRVVFMDSGLIW